MSALKPPPDQRDVVSPVPAEVEALVAEARQRARRRRARYAFAFAALVLVAVGLYFVFDQVAVSSHGRDSALNAAVGFSSCPRQVKEFSRATKPEGVAGAVVPVGPVAGQLCVYSSDRGAPTPLRWTALLPEVRARALALLLDRRGDLGFGSCDAGHPVLMQLRYRGGGVRSFFADGCDPELISTPSGPEALSPSASLAVAGLIEPPLPTGGRVTRTFDYLGLSLAAAARAGKWRVSAPGEGAQLYEVDDPGVATGQVVWQVPLPGTKQHGSETGAQLFIAVHPAPPCRADQLKGRYQNGQAVMAGMHLGSIELVDASPHACSLRGRIELQGLSSTGQADTETYSQPVGPPVVLSPRTTLWTFRDARATALIATFGFIGSSAAPDGPCQTRNITPSAWTITLSNGTALRITNHAPGNGGPFYTCQGSLTHGVDRGVEILGT